MTTATADATFAERLPSILEKFMVTSAANRSDETAER